MKLLLFSLPPTEAQAPQLAELIGRQPKDTRVALIENAADVYKAWVNQIRPALQKVGFDVEVVDLHDYRKDRTALKTKLASKDIIWIGGGNTYYIRWLLRDTGADEIIRELVRKGTVYGGDSAGAILAGPTTKHFEPADDPNDAPEVLYDGLGFTRSVAVPHIDNKKFAPVIQGINDALKADGYKTVPLGDAQALILNGSRKKII